VRDAGRAASAAIETMDIKTALMADKRVDASGIDVDTDHKQKTVTLKGEVPTAAQKATAEQIAVKEATGYRVVNRLIVKS
jgi:osmotically-inducible protein OsmY